MYNMYTFFFKNKIKNTDMRKVLLIISLFVSMVAKCETLIVEYNGIELHIPSGKGYKVGQQIEITRSQWGNTPKITDWAINTSPILGDKAYDKIAALAPCETCTMGNVVMKYEYAKVTIKRIM